MQEETRAPEARARRIYRHRFRWAFAALGAILAASAAYSLAFGLVTGNVSNVFLGLLWLPNIVFMFLLARVLRVETSPEGLAFHNLGFYTVRARWEDVDRVARVPFPAMGRVECVLLRRSTVRGWPGLAWAVPKAERRSAIPLGKSWSSWSDADDLRRDISRHAPQVRGIPHRPTKPSGKPTPQKDA